MKIIKIILLLFYTFSACLHFVQASEKEEIRVHSDCQYQEYEEYVLLRSLIKVVSVLLKTLEESDESEIDQIDSPLLMQKWSVAAEANHPLSNFNFKMIEMLNEDKDIFDALIKVFCDKKKIDISTFKDLFYSGKSPDFLNILFLAAKHIMTLYNEAKNNIKKPRTKKDLKKFKILQSAAYKIRDYLLPMIESKLTEVPEFEKFLLPMIDLAKLLNVEPVLKKEPMFSRNVTFLGMGGAALGIVAGAVLLHSKGYFDSAIEKITDIWTRTVTPYVSEVINFWPRTVTPFFSAYIFKNPFVKN
jgi:hypothetical protein